VGGLGGGGGGAKGGRTTIVKGDIHYLYDGREISYYKRLWVQNSSEKKEIAPGESGIWGTRKREKSIFVFHGKNYYVHL